MEIRHLRSVVAIARHGSFTKAGEELHLAKSAVSQQLSRLESELGITLFTRSSRSVELTPEGALVLDYAQRVLSEVDGLRDELDERQESPPQGRKWKVAVCGPQRPAQVALGTDFTIGWDSNAADFAMTLGEFYCKGLTAPVMVEIKRDDVVFARVYDIRGRSISSLLSIPPP